MSKKTPVKLVRQPNSPYLYARFKCWDAGLGEWKYRFKSTERTDPDEAMGVAVKMADAARVIAAAAKGGTNWSREKALALVNELLAAAGLPVEHPVPLWEDFAKGWLEMKRQLLLAKQLSPDTFDLYGERVNPFTAWLGTRAKQPLNGVTPLDGQRYYNHLLKNGQLPTTAEQTIKTLKSVFKSAIHEGHLPRNPFGSVQTSDDVSLELDREPFTPGDIKKLLTAAALRKKHAEEWVTMIHLGMCLGGRISDCAQLGVSHLQEYPDGLITIKFTPRKTRRKLRAVEVPVVEPLLSRLMKMKRSGATLFCPHIAELVDPSAHFAHIVAAAGLEQKPLVNPVTGRRLSSKSFHSFRHTLPGALQAAGVDEATRMLIVAHTDENTHRNYTHTDLRFIEKGLKKAVAKLVA